MMLSCNQRFLLKTLLLQIPNMSRRQITPYDARPSKDFLESLVAELGDNHENPSNLTPVDPKKGKSKKKRHRTKSTADEGDKSHDRGTRKGSESEKGPGPERGRPRRMSERQLSISSDISVKSEEDVELQAVLELDMNCTVSAMVRLAANIS